MIIHLRVYILNKYKFKRINILFTLLRQDKIFTTFQEEELLNWLLETRKDPKRPQRERFLTSCVNRNGLGW